MSTLAERPETSFSTDLPDFVDSTMTRFKVGNVQFIEGNSDGVVKHPIRMLARTNQPLDHWYWGRIVHDMEGMKFHKDSIVVDYCHDEDKIIGYLDSHGTSDSGFTCEGALVRIPGGKAEEVIVNGANGVPYEASIYWDPDSGVIVEQIGEGMSSEVNGFTFHGPGVIIRECKLRAVAVCPHGYDMNAETQFTTPGNRNVKLTYKDGKTMPKETNPAEDQPTELTTEQKFEELSKKYDDLEAKFEASKKGEGDEPKDLPAALARIKHLQTQLTPAAIREIQRLRDGGMSYEDISTALGTGSNARSAGTISAIHKGEIENEPPELLEALRAIQPPEKGNEMSARIEALEKRFEAKLSHDDSSGDSVDGGGDGDGAGKTKFSSFFKMPGASPAGDE